METSTLINPEKAILPAILVAIQKNGEDYSLEDELDELESLLNTLNIKASGRVIQKRHKLSASHLLGIGKVEEIKNLADETGAGLVVIDHPLSGPQVRNLEKITKCQVLDRAGIILDIFARHAKSKQAKTQVEIAQLEYLLPRLTGAWTHFQRQTGGGVRARGMGEKQIEVDRRRARERIAKLSKRLDHIKKERETQRKSRQNEIKVSIVGYTNSGKTTLMRNLTKANISGKDELFATLDASVRALDPSTRPKILLSDTVGFIRNLPHSLVESFKSTLEEVLNADLLLHVVDLSHPNYHAQMKTTEEVLEEIGAGSIPMLLVFNKIDLVDERFLGKILQKKYNGSIAISAHEWDDVKRLRSHLFNYFMTKFRQIKLTVPSNDKSSLSIVYQSCIILDANYETEGVVSFDVRAPETVLARLSRFQEVDPGLSIPPHHSLN
ncbi:MAG: GTPase HflX [Oligoflexales bacterium]|nr:GTPase HflX [Oligoflexales bacterium]